MCKSRTNIKIVFTFCAITWSIFHVGRKVRWVLKSKFHGLSNGYQKFLCTCSRTRENNKNKVKSDLWDTLYLHIHISISAQDCVCQPRYPPGCSCDPYSPDPDSSCPGQQTCKQCKCLGESFIVSTEYTCHHSVHVHPRVQCLHGTHHCAYKA